MYRSPRLIASLVLTLAAGAAGPAAQAQMTSYPYYPYWSSAPSGYQGSVLQLPGPIITPNTISNITRSPSGYSFEPLFLDSIGAGVGGRQIPAFLRMADSRSGLVDGNPIVPDNKAHIWLRVPAGATVWVDGNKTQQTGEARHFLSPPLTPGKSYTYQLRVRWMKDGKPVEQNRDVAVHAGSHVSLDITRPRTDKDGK
jgi:uncharacterized protein (TIGR03000 family)